MKNKYKVVALVPLEFSVEGNSDSKEAIESVKNIFEACRDDNDCADIVFDGIEESLRHDSIEYKVEFTHPDLVAEFNGEPLPEQESNPEFYKTDFLDQACLLD